MSPVDGCHTRLKGRKQRQNGAVDVYDNILRSIHATKVIEPGDVIQLYHLDKPICHGCRGNSKESPNCFCGLVPPPTGFRKQGLWQKISDRLDELGPDPSDSLRTSQNFPCGLTNLGATCYVNSVLQCLFMNTAFRNGVFAAEPDLVICQPVLYQLSRLFAQLHSGKKIAVDSAPFASTLELDNAVQQDGQEFLKLLLTLLERVLGLSKNPRARNVIQNVFRGTFSYVTKCCKCGQESDVSKDAVDFYELELNVKGFSSLDESLSNYLCEEYLQGENQYRCESCKTRVDATHSTKLRSLPPVLNFQLKRFVFNAKTAARRKVTSKFSFPRRLDMTPHLSGQPSSGEAVVYDLSAVLVHKGTLVNSGHYVAHVKEEHTGVWWQFDDEQVTSLGSHPLGKATGTANVKGISSWNDEALPMRAELNVEGSEEHVAEALGGEYSSVSEAFSRPLVHKDSDVLISADAYMLMYSHRGQLDDLERVYSSASSLDGPVVGLDIVQTEGSLATGFSLPDRFQSEIEEMNHVFDNTCWAYNRQKKEEETRLTERRLEVRRVIAEAPVKLLGDPFFWISSDWLRSWADTLDPPTSIENTPLLCEHQKIAPNKVHLSKRISQTAWNSLFVKYKGGPVLSEKDYCVKCIFEDARVAASACSYQDERANMWKIVDAVLNGHRELEGKLYMVSRTWLTQWARRKAGSAPSEVDACPTAALCCLHGGLLPENAPGAKRQLIPERVWDYFYRNALQVEGMDPRGYVPFQEDEVSCLICQSEIDKVASRQENLRATKIEQRMRHEGLYAGRGVVVYPGESYYLVPSLWLNRWRSYLGASGKNMMAVDEPDGLEGLLLSLICPRHDGVLFKPPPLARTRRGELIPTVGKEDIFTIVTKDDWISLCLEWDVDPQKGIEAFLKASTNCNLKKGVDLAAISRSSFGDTSSCSSSGRLIDMALGDPDGRAGGLDGEDKSEVAPALQTSPEVCQECIDEREVNELRSKLHYTNGQISVDLVVGREPPASLLAAGRLQETRRTSKRARRASTTSGGRAFLNVSGDTTVFQLKLQIWEALAIVRENQKVHFGNMELLDESATLADLNILAGSQLWVVDSGQHENRDIADELPAAELGNAEPEEGFRGTRLMMGLPNTVGSLSSMEELAAAISRSDMNGIPATVVEPSCLLPTTFPRAGC